MNELTSIWIFLAILPIGKDTMLVSPNDDKFRIKYAFQTKEICENAIKDSTVLKCIQLKMFNLKE